jgi:hypothetical protein
MSDYADGVIASPAAVTTEPSWASNSYIGQKEVYRRESHEVGLIARQFIGSGTRGNISQLRARLHIIGPGVASEIGSTAATRIARFEKQDGTEAFGVTDNGVVLVPLSMKVGAVGGTITSHSDGHDKLQLGHGEREQRSSCGHQYFVRLGRSLRRANGGSWVECAIADRNRFSRGVGFGRKSGLRPRPQHDRKQHRDGKLYHPRLGNFY